MARKFFLLPALAVILALVGLTGYYHVAGAVAVADDGDSDCICDPPRLPPGGSAVNFIDPNDPAEVAAYLDALAHCDDPLPPPPPICTHAGCTSTGCPADSISIGKINVSALKTAPLYPMVIGQDDTKRGADISWFCARWSLIRSWQR